MLVAANRLNNVKEYYFSQKLKEVRELVECGKPVINAGIGSPDLLPPQEVVNAISQAVKEPYANKYQSYLGLPELRSAMAQFYESHYGVCVNPDGQVLPLMGSKEGIMHISLAFLNSGDQVLVPDPGYPTYSAVAQLCEAQAIPYTLKKECGYQPEFDQLEKLDLSKVKIMWVNYPHMPTGARATRDVFEKLIAFGKRHNILIVNDNPYSLIGYERPLSIMKIEGVSNGIIELNSLSKSFNMAGWRVGMMIASKELINQVLKVKTNMDSGMFYGIQQGAITALRTSKSWLQEQNHTYASRRVLMEEFARSLDCRPINKEGGMFLWCALPQGKKDSLSFVDEVLARYDVFIAPGDIFGNEGKGHVRFSLCVPEDQIKTMLNRTLMTV